MNTNIFNSVTNFLKKRTFEFLGLILIFTSIGLAIAFTTYSPEDPSIVYGDRNFEIKNFFGIYGSSIADFLLQSFGLASFLLLANFLFWGINLIIKKEIKKIILRLFLVISYLSLGTIFIYMTFNNSFWLIDNGNSGFVGKIGYNFLSSWFPWIDNQYTAYGLLLLTFVLFIFSSDLNFQKILPRIFSFIISLFKGKNDKILVVDFDAKPVEEENKITQKPQQTFSFDNELDIQKQPGPIKSKYKLPNLDYLEKNSSKLNSLDLSKNTAFPQKKKRRKNKKKK